MEHKPQGKNTDKMDDEQPVDGVTLRQGCVVVSNEPGHDGEGEGNAYSRDVAIREHQSNSDCGDQSCSESIVCDSQLNCLWWFYHEKEERGCLGTGGDVDTEKAQTDPSTCDAGAPEAKDTGQEAFKSRFFSRLFLLSALLAAVSLLSVCRLTSDNPLFQAGKSFLHCLYHVPLLFKLIAFLSRIFILIVILHLFDYIQPGKRKVSYYELCKADRKIYFKLQYQLSESLFANFISRSKGHIRQRSKKGKHQRWKKVNHKREHFDMFHFLRVRPDFINRHLRSATIYPVNQQGMGQNPGQASNNEGQFGASDRSQPPEFISGIPWSAFREEMRRLMTFAELPITVPVFVIRLAQTGFLRLPDGTIICYFCRLVHNTWSPGDIPVDVHRRRSPQCPMVTGFICDNQPVGSIPDDRGAELKQIWSLQGAAAHGSALVEEMPGGQGQKSSGHSSFSRPGELASATNRVSGLSSLPAIQGPSQQPSASGGHQPSLPSAALSADAHMGDQNPPQAAPANVTGQNTNLGTAGIGSNNMRDAASGPIMDGTAQPAPPTSLGHESRETTRPGQQVVTYEQLGISTENPKRLDMAMVNARVGTFRNWPPGNSHTPLQLAEAGFYFAGYADCGRCFFCGGGLKNWEANDNPWVEHARWFPRCPYVRQCQGQDFIDVVQDLNANRQQISMAEVKGEINRRRAEGEHLQPPVVDPAISSALEQGYTQEQVDQAIRLLQQQGFPLTGDKLIDYLQEGEAQAMVNDEGIDDEDYEPGRIDGLVEENNEIRQQRMCKICLDKEVCIVFLPCGHLVSCAECSPAIRLCPMCRQRVKGRVRAFPS